MTNDAGPANLAFDFAEKGAEPLDRPLTGDLAGPRAHGPSRTLLLDVREVGEALGCGKTYVYELIARGELPTVKLGRLTRIPAFALADFVGRKLGSNPSNPLLEQPSDAPFRQRGARPTRDVPGTDAQSARRDGPRR
jgi:excisionase family DNA binding protein